MVAGIWTMIIEDSIARMLAPSHRIGHRFFPFAIAYWGSSYARNLVEDVRDALISFRILRTVAISSTRFPTPRLTRTEF